jgi:two-component system response regulator
MNERDVKLLFNANHWSGAKVKYAPKQQGWLVELEQAVTRDLQVLTLKRGKPRIFKTSDTALMWCRDIGFQKITVQLHKYHDHESSKTLETPIILLVEDNDNDIELTFRAIQRLDANFDIIVCRDGQEALDFLFARGKYASRNTQELPQLILLDINLPKIDGITVLQRIRAADITRNLPVVMLTTSDEKSDIKKCYEGGVNSYVCKPVDYSAFCDTLKALGEYWLNTNSPPIND